MTSAHVNQKRGTESMINVVVYACIEFFWRKSKIDRCAMLRYICNMGLGNR